MTKHLKMMGFYFWVLALFTVGRWAISFSGTDFAKATHVFSLVTLALIASAHHGAFARGFGGYSLKDAAVLGALIGIVTQVVILGSTVLSYALGLSTLWNAPVEAFKQTEALTFATAMVERAKGLVGNTILNAIAAVIGYTMGGSLKAAK